MQVTPKKLLIIAIGNIRNPELAGLLLQAMPSLAVTAAGSYSAYSLVELLAAGVTLPGAHQSSPLGLLELQQSTRRRASRKRLAKPASSWTCGQP